MKSRLRQLLEVILCTQIALATPSRRPVLQFPSQWPLSRKLAENTPTNCSICGPHDLTPEYLPLYESNEVIPPGMSCHEFESFANSEESDSLECIALQRLAPQCCDGPPTYICEANIRRQLFDQYDIEVPPIPNGYKEPLVVTVLTRFQAVENIDVQKGTAQMLVTLTLQWKDPRLAWQVGPDFCGDLISLRASHDLENTEIWVPDFDLYNQIEGVQQFPDSKAELSPDGSIQWVRTGTLYTICQFYGLAQIPFDTLACQLLLGPRERLGYGHLDFRLEGDVGFGFGTFGAVYNEYTVVPEMTQSGRTSGNETIYYNFYFKRAKQHYVFNIVIPTIILTYVSFGTFLLDLRLGERLSYGMSLALVVVAQQIVTGDLIPVSDERLWIDKFVVWSFYWVIFGLVESVSLGYMFFLRQDRNHFQDPTHAASAERNAALGIIPQPPTQDPPEELDEVNGHNSSMIVNASGFTERQTAVPGHKDIRDQHQHNGAEKPLILNWLYKVPLRRVDHFCFMLTTLSYTSYVIAMFASVDRWGSRVEGEFLDENDTLFVNQD